MTAQLLDFKFLISNFKFQITLFLFLTLICTLYAVPSAHAQPSATQSATPINSTLYAVPSPPSYVPLPQNLSPQSPQYTNLIFYNIMHTFYCIGIGQSPISPCVEYKITQDLKGNLQSVPVLSSVNTSGGVLGFSTSLVATLFEHKPVTTGEYLAGVKESLGFIPEAHAQVSGSGNTERTFDGEPIAGL